ncbi:hypothetical protein FZX02_04085 [Synechococcus sp. MU1644]|nr:hypothetical protein [Synechococcus sp. MU1644]
MSAEPMLSATYSTDENPTDLCELRLQADGSIELELRAALRLGPIELDLDTTRYQIGVTGAVLSLDLEGLETVLGAHFGAVNSMQSRVSIESSAAHQEAKSVALTSILSAKSDAQAKMSVQNAKSRFSRTTAASAFDHNGMKLRPNNKWRVEDPKNSKRILDDSILNGEVLCKLVAKGAANRMHLTADVYCSNNDFEVKKVAGGKIRNRNKEKILQLIATKSLSGEKRYSPSTSTGIQLSKVTMEFEKLEET